MGAAAREATPHNAPAFQAPKLLPTFSRRREVFAGRWAMLGFAAACAWEVRGQPCSTLWLIKGGLPAVSLHASLLRRAAACRAPWA